MERLYSTDFAKANVLNEYFYSVFTQDKSTAVTALPDMGNILYPDIPTIEVDTGGIAKLSEIDPCKAMGPNCPTRLLLAYV